MSKETLKTWHDFTPVYRSKLAGKLADEVLGKTSTVEEAVDYLSRALKSMEAKTKLDLLPNLRRAIAQTQDEAISPAAKELLQHLAALRQTQVTHHSQEHQQRFSAADIDLAVVQSGFTRENLQTCGYNIGRTTFKRLQSAPEEACTSRVGRRSKVLDTQIISSVQEVLQKYVAESSKVVVVREAGKKQLVCAKVLRKRLWRIWKEKVD